MKLSVVVVCGLLAGVLPCKAQNEENQAGAMLRAGNVDGAIAALTTAIARQPTARLYATRAEAHLRKGRVAQSGATASFDSAIADATEALRRDAAGAAAAMTRAQARQAKGEHALAITDFTLVLSTNPGSADALAGRSLAYKAMGNTAAAQKDLQAVSQISARKAGELRQKLGGQD